VQAPNKKENFIPLRKVDLIDACINEGSLDTKQQKAFKQLSELIIGTLHFEYHQQLESLKNNYAPFDPNRDTIALQDNSPETLHAQQKAFAETFSGILKAGNFVKITEQDLQDALAEESLFKVRLAVEFDDFAEVVFYRRGEHQRTETVSTFFGLKKQTITFTNYDKVAVYIRFKDHDYFTKRKRKTLHFEPNSTIIKLFQDVPKADLEMLFPNSEVKMRSIDKAIIGGSALVGGAIVLVTKLGASIVLIAALLAYWIGFKDEQVTIGTQELIGLGAAAGVLGGFIFKEWSKFKNRKLKFMKALADNLYFKSLDNNAGVFHHLIDAAEEEECKEAILAYYFLLINKTPMTAKQLDEKIESWFQSSFGVDIDFEIEDALQKLERFGIVNKLEGVYEALNMPIAYKQLDQTWDSIFTSKNEEEHP
jgi:hypothetical protein